MEDIRGDDLHHNREADFISHLDCFFFVMCQVRGGNGQTVSFENVLGFNFGQSVATLGAGRGNDLEGFFFVHIGGFVHAVVSGFQ